MTGNTEINETPYPRKKSSKSNGGNGGCVEWQWQADGGLFIFDSKNPADEPKRYNRVEAECFMFAVRNGEIEPPAELGL